MSRLRFAWRSLAKAPLLSPVDSDRRVGDGSSGGTAVGAIYRDAVVRREGGRRGGGGRRGAGVDGDGDCGGGPAGAPGVAGESAGGAALRGNLSYTDSFWGGGVFRINYVGSDFCQTRTNSAALHDGHGSGATASSFPGWASWPLRVVLIADARAAQLPSVPRSGRYSGPKTT